MWAMGVILYTMLCGQFPFYDSDRQQLFKKIRSADFIIPWYVCLHSSSLLNFLTWGNFEGSYIYIACVCAVAIVQEGSNC